MNNSYLSKINPRETLQDKVVLLLGGTKVGGPSLAASLAERGADIAVVYFGEQHQRATELKRRVEANGQRCLTFAAEPERKTFPQEVISKIVDELGHLDIFIDYAALPRPVRPDTGNGRDRAERADVWSNPFSNFEMMAAALGQLTSTDRATPRHKTIQTPRRETMHVANEYIGKPIISIVEGTEVGRLEDLYLDAGIETVTGLYLGSKGLIDRVRSLVPWEDVVTMGGDVVLVNDASSVVNAADHMTVDTFVRRKEIIGREIDTPGGTRLARIGDIIIDQAGKVVGFTLSQTFVTGPIADNRVIGRSALLDIGEEDGTMTANLSDAEEAEIKIVYEGLFGEPTVATSEERTE